MSTLRYIVVLTAISALAAGLLAYVSMTTAAPIARSIQQEQTALIKRVISKRYPDIRLPISPDSNPKVLTIRDAITGIPKTLSFIEGTDDSGRLSAVAVRTCSYSGYSGIIKILVGIDRNGTLISTEILEHRETPGLGTKLTDEKFKNQFAGLSHSREAIAITKYGGTIESIAGASISSHAFTSAVSEALQSFALLYLPAPDSLPADTSTLPETP